MVAGALLLKPIFPSAWDFLSNLKGSKKATLNISKLLNHFGISMVAPRGYRTNPNSL
jgi:hypothetical protein